MTAQPPDPGVYIPPAQMYAEVQRLGRKVDQIDGKLDRFLEEMREVKSDLSDHEARIRALELGETERQKRNEARIAGAEARRWPLPAIGAATGVAGAVTAVVAMFVR
ncbi:hypothetical protein DIZ27_32920 [Streptomyces sp. NWU339]|uniref:hypothetical protein n=1 Tax=Streptomyces sp. NWU339 TaxID=2185284 RepID=UPI000D67D513|nr:hypothetical protein [Streptomyces sp. NWU339]PWI06544.1 hypothetical protein DIZ27_32920 [Streptomyces sp. NWU339]